MAMPSLYNRRQWRSACAVLLSAAATLLGLGFLASILWTTVRRGLSAISVPLFTSITAYAEQGGLANAIVGSLIINLIAIAVCAPIGVMAGAWLAEYARHSRIGDVIRFLNDILLSAPSIVIGLFIYMVLVLPMNALSGGNTSFSALAGAVALALIGLPVIVRTTDQMLQLVPSALREAALSLGIPQWKLVSQLLMRAAGSGILTGVLLATARLAGETAPLLFTAFGNNFMAWGLLDKMSSVPTAVYQYTNDPNPAMQAIAWAGALLVSMFVLALGLVARVFLANRKPFHD